MASLSENRLFLLLFLSLLLAGITQAAAQSRDFRQAPKALTA
ncbi:lytic transglycosylase domain-containing protein, partial [Aeromonas salmonicida]